jgi:acetoin utilization protein AcuB
MLVRERMTTVLFTVPPDASVAEVERVMRYQRIRHVPVVDDGRLVGMVTDRDVRTAMPSSATTLAAGEAHYLLDRLRVERVMSHPVITVGPDAHIVDAVGLVLAHRIGALPVMESGRMVGIITETDLLRAFAATCASCAAMSSREAVETARSPERAGADEPGALRPPSCPARPDAGHSILVPLDGSPGSESVLPTVGELARARGARVRLLRVAAVPPEVRFGDRVLTYADQEAGRVELETLAYLRRMAEALPGVEVEPVFRFGETVDEIVREAQTARVDLIAMATHRRTGLDWVLKGSVAETVERAAAIPVVLVPYGSPLS